MDLLYKAMIIQDLTSGKDKCEKNTFIIEYITWNLSNNRTKKVKFYNNDLYLINTFNTNVLLILLHLRLTDAFIQSDLQMKTIEAIKTNKKATTCKCYYKCYDYYYYYYYIMLFILLFISATASVMWNVSSFWHFRMPDYCDIL